MKQNLINSSDFKYMNKQLASVKYLQNSNIPKAFNKKRTVVVTSKSFVSSPSSIKSYNIKVSGTSKKDVLDKLIEKDNELFFTLLKICSEDQLITIPRYMNSLFTEQNSKVLFFDACQAKIEACRILVDSVIVSDEIERYDIRDYHIFIPDHEDALRRQKVLAYLLVEPRYLGVKNIDSVIIQQTSKNTFVGKLASKMYIINKNTVGAVAYDDSTITVWKDIHFEGTK